MVAASRDAPLVTPSSNLSINARTRTPEEGLLALYGFDPRLGYRIGPAADFPLDTGEPLSSDVVFVNLCNGEKYDLRGGNLAGPSPRGLDRFAVTAPSSSRCPGGTDLEAKACV